MDYKLLSTTRYDPTLSTLSWNDDCDGPSPYLLLPYHHERLQNAAQRHGWASVATHAYPQFKSAIADAVSKQRPELRSKPESAFRVRILLSQTGALEVTATILEGCLTHDPLLLPTRSDVQAQSNSSMISVYIDRETTYPSLFTKTKTTLRKTYDEARLRNGLSSLATLAGKTTDVLLHNKDAFAMETSIFNVAFHRRDRWVTPSSDTGCLPGVIRRWLLEHGRIDEDTAGILQIGGIKNGESVLLFNGVQGCRLGKIVDIT